jgi:tetratricopeptide (TPR) repeat protein
VYVESGDYEKGLEALADLLEEDPGNSLILSTIGWTHYLQADYEKALEAFETILTRTPTDEHALYNAAILSLKLEEKETALVYFQRLYSENGETEVLYRIASLYLDLQRWNDAVEALTEYLEAKPDDADAYYDLGIAFSAERYYGKALDAFDSGILLKKYDPLLNFEKAVVLILYIENIDEGLKALEIAVTAGFNDSERITALLRADELRFAQELVRFFDEKKLLPQEFSADTPAEQGGSAEKPPGEQTEKAGPLKGRGFTGDGVLQGQKTGVDSEGQKDEEPKETPSAEDALDEETSDSETSADD